MIILRQVTYIFLLMCLFPITIRTHPKVGFSETVTVSCGKCLQCLQRASVEWAFRIVHECSQYSDNCFVTLTYDDAHLPSDGSVSRREVQLFMKSLRQVIRPKRVRFFASGEYGSLRGRPHYHIILFGFKPDDLCYLKVDRKGTKLWRSPLIEKCWKKGFISVGDVTYDTALYCAKYMQKFQFITGKKSSLTRPFVQMSNRPGIGYNCVYLSDLESDRIYLNGRSTKIPRYYLKVMERDGIELTDFKYMRRVQGRFISECTDIKLSRKKYHTMFLRKVVKQFP